MQLHLAAQLLAQNNDSLQTDKSDLDENQSVKSEAKTDDSKGKIITIFRRCTVKFRKRSRLIPDGRLEQ